MSKTLDQVTLLELLPPNLRGDPDIIAASAAADASFKELVSTINNVFTIADIDNASSEVVDALAVEMRCDFYDQSLPLENRRKLVKNAYLYKYLKGTPYCVDQILKDVYNTADLREWFDYGGAPYHFKIIVNESLESETERLMEAVKAVKNVRSYLDGVTVAKVANINVYVGMPSHRYTYHKIPAPKPYEGMTASIMGVSYNRRAK